MLLLVTILGFIAYGLLSWITGRVRVLPKGDEVLALIGCLPLSGGCVIVTFLLYQLRIG